MPLLIPDLHRQTLDSIDRASDVCGKWRLWHRGDHLDSIICCKLFPNRHQLTDAAIARFLGAERDLWCANMTGKDVAELYYFLEANPDLHTNSIRLWQGIKATASEHRAKHDDVKVGLAIARFSSKSPTKKRLSL